MMRAVRVLYPAVLAALIAADTLVQRTADAQPAAPFVLSQLTWFARSGERLSRVGPPADHGTFEISPDGARIAVAVGDRQRRTRDIWMYDTAGAARARFTTDPADENWLLWSPDGRRVAINAVSSNTVTLYESPAGDADSRLRLIDEPGGVWPVSWSPEGDKILYVTNSRETGNDIWVLPLSGNRTPYPFLRTTASENWATFSPDGRFVAYSSATGGGAMPEVFVARFPGGTDARRISADGGSQARWRRDGREIFYLSPDRQLMVVPIELGSAPTDALTVGRVEPLFTIEHPYGAYRAFDVAADGSRLLVNTLAVDPAAPGLRVSR
jgi:Tol biopolymer transport system component